MITRVDLHAFRLHFNPRPSGMEHFLFLSCRVNELPWRVRPPQMQHQLCDTPPKRITFNREIFSKSIRIQEIGWLVQVRQDVHGCGRSPHRSGAPSHLWLLTQHFLKTPKTPKRGPHSPHHPFLPSLMGLEKAAEAKVLWFCLILYLCLTFFSLVSAGDECHRLSRGALCGSQGSEGEQDTPTLSTNLPLPVSQVNMTQRDFHGTSFVLQALMARTDASLCDDNFYSRSVLLSASPRCAVHVFHVASPR